jgi:hypothetical protein
MKALPVEGRLTDSVTSHTVTIAMARGSSEPDLEDQIRVIRTLIDGLRVISSSAPNDGDETHEPEFQRASAGSSK